MHEPHIVIEDVSQCRCGWKDRADASWPCHSGEDSSIIGANDIKPFPPKSSSLLLPPSQPRDISSSCVIPEILKAKRRPTVLANVDLYLFRVDEFRECGLRGSVAKLERSLLRLGPFLRTNSHGRSGPNPGLGIKLVFSFVSHSDSLPIPLILSRDSIRHTFLPHRTPAIPRILPLQLWGNGKMMHGVKLTIQLSFLLEPGERSVLHCRLKRSRMRNQYLSQATSRVSGRMKAATPPAEEKVDISEELTSIQDRVSGSVVLLAILFQCIVRSRTPRRMTEGRNTFQHG